MLKIKIFVVVLIIGLIAPSGFALAAYNDYIWSTGTTLYFTGVAAEQSAEPGVQIIVKGDSYLYSYTLDVSSLYVEMYPNSELHLKSMDRKMFTTNIATAETVCTDEYSTFDFVAGASYKNFKITFSDNDNCPAVVAEEVIEEKETTGQIINLFDLTSKVTQSGLLQNDKVSFIINNILEIITIESVSAVKAKISLKELNKTFYLKLGQRQNVDIDADEYRDVRLTFTAVNKGQASISLEPINVIKLDNIKPGDLVKSANSSAVYYIGEDSARYAFPNSQVYYSWYNDFADVKEISGEDLAKYPLAGLVTYKPGVKLVTFITSPDVYVVAQGGVLRKLKDEAMAAELYGENWNKQIDDVNDAFYVSYSFGADLVNSSEYNKETQMILNPTITKDKDI